MSVGIVGFVRPIFFALLLSCAIARADVAVEIDLSSQSAYLLENGRRVAATPIASGRASHPTPAGDFAVTGKELIHKSTLYGRVVDAEGSVVVRDADANTEVPEGGEFVQAPMPHFMRFNGAVGMHAGRLPGYAASHGCVRLPAEMATYFYNRVRVGTPVRVIGKAPSGHVVRTAIVKTPDAPPPTPARQSFWSRLFSRPTPEPTPALRGGRPPTR